MGNIFWPGEKLYHYSIRNGKFAVKEGVVRESATHWSYPYVDFQGERRLAPRKDKIGKLCQGGPSLWLFERDDELAKKMFIEYEEKCIEKLQQDIDKRRELIEIIKEG